MLHSLLGMALAARLFMALSTMDAFAFDAIRCGMQSHPSAPVPAGCSPCLAPALTYYFSLLSGAKISFILSNVRRRPSSV